MDILETWDQQDMPLRSKAELVQGLEATGQMIQAALARWVPTDLEEVFYRTYQGQSYELSRHWAVWHTLEHDLHHGGELSLILGIHGLAAPDI